SGPANQVPRCHLNHNFAGVSVAPDAAVALGWNLRHQAAPLPGPSWRTDISAHACNLSPAERIKEFTTRTHHVHAQVNAGSVGEGGGVSWACVRCLCWARWRLRSS